MGNARRKKEYLALALLMAIFPDFSPVPGPVFGSLLSALVEKFFLRPGSQNLLVFIYYYGQFATIR